MKDRWTKQIDEVTENFVNAFGKMNVQQLNWKPNGQTWSIGQILDHLTVINRSYYPVLKEVKTGVYQPPFMARWNFMVSFLGKMILNSVQPDRKRKTKTFPIWEPTQSEVPPDILTRFVQEQDELKKVIQGSYSLLDAGTVISSPANRNIVYKLETAFDIMVAHERRHFNQAKEIEMMMNPK